MIPHESELVFFRDDWNPQFSTVTKYRMSA